MSKKLNVLFVPTELAGHVNAGLGLAITLRDRGHRVHYVLNECHKEIVDDLGFRVTTVEYDDQDDFETIYYRMVAWVYKQDLITTIRYLANAKQNCIDFFRMTKRFVVKDRTLQKLIAATDPDIIIVDDLFCYPAIINSGKPWVFFYSPNPMWFYQDHSLNFPTLSKLHQVATSKLVILNHPATRISQNVIVRRVLWWYFTNSFKLFNLCRFYLRGHFFERDLRIMPYSPYLNLYCMPSELDVKTKNMKYKNSFRLEYFTKLTMLNSHLESSLKSFIDESAGKTLIYLSFGTVCCDELSILRRLISVLSTTKHRVIVSKGNKHQELSLAANMWGDRYVPQKAILPLVDIFITHAGYNSVVESLTAGKPMIMLPLWMDTFDNATRVQELGYGVRLNALTYTDTELTAAIDQLLADNHLKQTLTRVAERMRSEDRLEVAANLVENVNNFSQ